MSILIATAELEGYTTLEGSLPSPTARLSNGLATALRNGKKATSLVLPLYKPLMSRLKGLKATGLTLNVKLGHSDMAAPVWRAVSPTGVPLWLVERDEFFNREAVFGPDDTPYGDNAARFLFFSHAAVALLPHINPTPELVHCLDWPTGIIPAITRQLGLAIPTVFTFNTLVEQGRFPKHDFELTNLPWDYFAPHGVEFHGDLNLTKAGLVFGHHVTTRSAAYAEDVATPEFGAGLEGVLQDLSPTLSGIHPGIDTTFWNPEGLDDFAKPFSAKKPGNKAAAKKEVQKLLGLAARKRAPLVAWLAPLSPESGCEQLMQVMNELVGSHLQLVVAAQGDPFYTDYFQTMAASYPKQIAYQPTIDPGHHYHLLAGADYLLCPATYPASVEPILEAARLGVLPISQHLGAARDWLFPVTEGKKAPSKRKLAGRIPAVELPNGQPETLLAELRLAIGLADHDKLLEDYQAAAMGVERGWKQAAKDYLAVYEQAKQSL